MLQRTMTMFSDDTNCRVMQRFFNTLLMREPCLTIRARVTLEVVERRPLPRVAFGQTFSPLPV